MKTAKSFTMKFDTRPITEGLDEYHVRLLLKGRYAVQQGAKIIHDAAKALVPVKTGLLKSAIYHTYSADNSEPGKTVFYHVGVNMRKAPHFHLIEYGHWTKGPHSSGGGSKGAKAFRSMATLLADIHHVPRWVPPRPFLRPAYYATVGLALETIKVKLGEGLSQ